MVKIHQETWELWSKIKLKVFLRTIVKCRKTEAQHLAYINHQRLQISTKSYKPGVLWRTSNVNCQNIFDPGIDPNVRNTTQDFLDYSAFVLVQAQFHIHTAHRN